MRRKNYSFKLTNKDEAFFNAYLTSSGLLGIPRWLYIVIFTLIINIRVIYSLIQIHASTLIIIQAALVITISVGLLLLLCFYKLFQFTGKYDLYPNKQPMQIRIFKLFFWGILLTLLFLFFILF